MCPEIFKGNYDEKCDIWSMGVFLNFSWLLVRLFCMYYSVAIHLSKGQMKTTS